MTRRSRAREVAMQLLFERDLNAVVSRADIEQFVKGRLREQSVRTFCLDLYDGVIKNQPDLDLQIGEAADNWRVARMAAVDRNVLRVAAFELLHNPETPPAAAMDEAIELARRYGAADSPAFVNGVLDRLRRGPETAEASTAEQPTAP